MKFELQEPQCLEEAASLMSKYGEDSRVIAGGQSLLPMIRTGLVRPSVLISLGLLKDLAAIKATSAGSFHRRSTDDSSANSQVRFTQRTSRRFGRGREPNRVYSGTELRHHRRQSLPQRDGQRSAERAARIER